MSEQWACRPSTFLNVERKTCHHGDGVHYIVVHIQNVCESMHNRYHVPMVMNTSTSSQELCMLSQFPCVTSASKQRQDGCQTPGWLRTSSLWWLTTNFHSHWLNTSRNFIHDIKILLAPRWCRWWPHIYRKEQTMWEVDQYQESMPQVPSYANWFCLYWKQTIFVTTHALSSTPSTLSTPEEVKNNLCFTRSLGSIWKDPTVW